MQALRAIRILVIDYHVIVSIGVSTILESYTDFEVVGQAANVEDVFQLIERSSPDVVCVDIDFPNPSTGMLLINQLHRKFPGIRAVILTNLLDETIIRDALQEGVVGYLLKSSSADELVHAIRSAYQGMPVLSPEVTQVLIRQLTAPLGHNLTSREQEVLELLAQGFNNHEIAKELNISLSTVQFHVSNILEKLAVHNRIEAATFAISHRLVTYGLSR